jgi:PhnB protein
MAKKARKTTTRPGAKGAIKPKRVAPVPAGYHTATPYLTVREAAKAIEFYQKALGARVKERMTGPDGTSIMHAELKVGDSIVMLSDELPQGDTKAPPSLGGSTGSVFLYMPNVDAAFKRAVDAGCQATMPPTDMFWGDRFGKLVDPFGHHWGLATHKEDVAPREMARRAREFAAQMGQGQPS